MRTEEQNVRSANKKFRVQIQVKIPIVKYKHGFSGRKIMVICIRNFHFNLYFVGRC